MTEKRATLVDREIKIEFPFDYGDLDKVRSLVGRRYHPEGKFWTCPPIPKNVDALRTWGFEGLQVARTEAPAQVIQVPGLKGVLFPFQEQGVGFLEARKGRALIGDEMGLGKTIQALAWLQLHPELRPAVVVVPASLKLNWLREAETWMPLPKVQVLRGTKASDPLTGDITVINYDILPAWLERLQARGVKALVADEAHYLINPRALRTKAFKALAKDVPHVIGLTGTPAKNRPREIDTIIRIIDPHALPSFWTCAQRYYGARHNGFGWTFDGATNTQEFHELLKLRMIRRLKEDVLKDLPPILSSMVPIEIDNPKEYASASNDFLAWVRENKGLDAERRANNAEQLARIEALRQIAITGKLRAAIEWIEDFLAGDGKLIVFATHRKTIEQLMSAFGDRAVKVEGGMSAEDKDESVRRFQQDESVRLFVGNIKAAGLGITLTAASNVAFLELPWSPSDITQAHDRAHRVGQKHTVNVYYLLAVGTIDEQIAYLIDNKRKKLRPVLDGKEVEGTSLLKDLFEKLETSQEVL